MRKVVRDDGENGLWISHPGYTSQMYHIDRAEYRKAWAFYKHEAQIEKEDLDGTAFDDRKKHDDEVNLNHRDETHVSEQETSEMPSELTDRDAEARKILDANPADETFDGDPVGANEEPAGMLEEDRKDPDASEAVESDSDEADAVSQGSAATAEKPEGE